MIVGLDASASRAGSGPGYVSNLLGAALPAEHGIDRFVVWGGETLLEALPERSFIEKAHEPLLDRGLPYRLYWQRRCLPTLASRRCDVLWAPAGHASPVAVPLVTMCHNLLPFDFPEARRYGISYMTLRLALLRRAHFRTFRRADGLIFLTRYVHDLVLRLLRVPGKIAIVPNGVEDRFRIAPRPQRPIEACSPEQPFRLLYVSILDVYKHQEEVALAVASLRASGLPLAIDFVGPAYPPSRKRLLRTIDRLDPGGRFLRYRGPVPFGEIHELHAAADAFVFASSCENMPLILLEAMAAGLPIAASSRGPMPEILGDDTVFFDPDRPDAIAASLSTLVRDPALRARIAAGAYARAQAFSWTRCARETLAFLAEVGRSSAPRRG